MFTELVKRTDERVFLDESLLNGRNINIKAKPFLLEVNMKDKYIEKAILNPDIPLFLTGIIQSGDKPNRNGRIYPWEYLKRECIRYMENEIKQGLSYCECFAEGHKILTQQNGWVDFKDLKEDAIVATMNPQTKNFEWQPITKKIAYYYSGDMIKLKSKTFDSLVTPNHKFFVTFNTNPLKYEKILAKDLNSTHIIPRKCLWEGINKEKIKIENKYGNLEIKTNLFCKFLGWWLAEGWYAFNDLTGNYSISLSQSKQERIIEIQNLLDELNWKYNININPETNEHTFNISGKLLADYFSQFGKSRDKFVPKEIKELKSEYIELFLEAFFKEDGCFRDFYTTSKTLAEDISELLYKTNFSASITEQQQYRTYYTVKNLLTEEIEIIDNFKFYTQAKYKLRENFEIIEKKREYQNTILYIVRKRISNFCSIASLNKQTIQYDGMVYCVEVPNHIILVMNKGKSFWSGNCDHPENSATPMLNNACASIEDIWFKDKDVWARIKVLNAYMPQSAPGLKIRGFLLNGKSVGISSRALGSLEEYSESDWDVVADDLEIICWDIVSNASNFGSEKLEMTEITDKIKNKRNFKYLTESEIKLFNKGNSIKEARLMNLTEEQKIYLNILGVEKFLQIYNKEINIK
jgi:hypothetical protein